MTAKEINQVIVKAHKHGQYCFACTDKEKIRIIKAQTINGVLCVQALSTGFWQSFENMHLELF